MSLFKKPLLDFYNLVTYQNDYLILHCSRNGEVYAPFDGVIKYDNNECVLTDGDIKLYINHISGDINGEVKAGDIIGRPMVGKGYSAVGYPIAYIGVKIYNDKEVRDVVAYLNHIDENIYGKKEAEIKKEVQSVQTQTKRKSNNRKKK